MERQTTKENSTSTTAESQEPFDTLCVLEFGADTKQAAIEWLIAKIHAPKSASGAELQAHTLLNRHNQEVILHIGASTARLLEGAELLQLKKEDNEGILREFSITELHTLKNTDDLSNFLTLAEKQKVIFRELESIRATESDRHIPGYEKKKLYKGQCIINTMLHRKLIRQVFPLHERDQLKRLGDEWYNKPFKLQPIEKIRSYFGETIAMYFAFLGFYTIALVPPAVVGLVYYLVAWKDMNRLAFFAVFNVVWATAFLKAWRRKSSELAYKWGTLNFVKLERTRAAYYGRMGTNAITKQPEPVYPKWKRTLRFYGVTVPVVLFCLFIAFEVMLIYFRLQYRAEDHHNKEQSFWSGIWVKVPSCLYTVTIVIMNGIYRKLAITLNDWENHRLQSAYENHLILKLVLFDFVNSFMSLFYVAFYMRDLPRLRTHLAILLVVSQLIGQIQETVLPYFLHSHRTKKMSRQSSEENIASESEATDNKDSDDSSSTSRSVISAEVRQQAEMENAMDAYEGTIDDYLEMFLQFGYVVLFSSVYPLAAVWALLNNITEIRTDSFKLCKVFQRPFSQSAASIGAWQIVFELMGIIAVITNCALVAMSLHNQKLLPELNSIDLVLLFVIAEHIVFALVAALTFLIPDLPRSVRNALARQDYLSRQAWKKERSKAARKQIFRSISTISSMSIGLKKNDTSSSVSTDV